MAPDRTVGLLHALPFVGSPMHHLFNLNSVARPGARGVRRRKKWRFPVSEGNLTATELRKQIEFEIGEYWSRTNLHHVDLQTTLLQEPRRIEVNDASGEKRLQVWLVLKECPGAYAGYGIVYSEADSAFGLIQWAKGYEPCLFGIYGSFLETLDAM